jgi:hypothetical protein
MILFFGRHQTVYILLQRCCTNHEVVQNGENLNSFIIFNTCRHMIRVKNYAGIRCPSLECMQNMKGRPNVELVKEKEKKRSVI